MDIVYSYVGRLVGWRAIPSYRNKILEPNTHALEHVPQCDLNPWKLPVDGESLEPATAAISWGDLVELRGGVCVGLGQLVIVQS